MSLYITKLSDILKNLELGHDTESRFIAFFSKIKNNQFVYPNRLADKLQTSNQKAAEVLHQLVIEELMVHVTVPMNPVTREVFEEDYFPAVLNKFNDEFVVFDEDQNEITSKELVPVAAFLKAL